jgi:hypothetical protein
MVMRASQYQDAHLLLHLAEWQTACGLPAALRWLWHEEVPATYADFVSRFPAGSEGDQAAILICGFYECVGNLVAQDLVRETLVLDWLSVGAVWDRIRGYVLGRRKEDRNPGLWHCFEVMATEHKRLTREYAT